MFLGIFLEIEEIFLETEEMILEIEETSEKRIVTECKCEWNIGLMLEKKSHILKC